MRKALDEFGGWLRVYFVLNVVSLVLGVIALVPTGGMILLFRSSGPFGSYPDDVRGALLWVSMLSLLVLAFMGLCFYILRVIRIRETDIPTRISVATILMFFICLLLDLGHAAFGYIFPASQEGWFGEFGSSILTGAVWTTVWVLYFLRSRRVRLYYGANAFRRSGGKGCSCGTT